MNVFGIKNIKKSKVNFWADLTESNVFFGD